MPQVITKEELVASLPPVATIMDAMKAAYVQYSDGEAWVAPVSHVLIEGQGDACIKAGYVKQQSSWVVKVAGGFPGNAALGLSNSQGVMLLFSQRTGELESVLADGGHLTDVRTAAAAALCVREFMPAGAQRLAVFGTGVIAKLVAEYCAPMFPAVCKSNLQPDFNVSVCECFDTRTSAVLRELDESNRFVQKSAESTSM